MRTVFQNCTDRLYVPQRGALLILLCDYVAGLCFGFILRAPSWGAGNLYLFVTICNYVCGVYCVILGGSDCLGGHFR